MVFSHGVLHHVPEIKQAEKEIHRVLRPGGELVIMMYARWSLNYLVSIALVRRAALLAAYPLAGLGIVKRGDGMLGAHVENARRIGLGRYLRLKEFTHYNTDGPGNPYALVYDRTADRAGLPLLPGDAHLQALHARAAAAGARTPRPVRAGLAPVGAPHADPGRRRRRVRGFRPPC